MPPAKLPRAELLVLVKHHLERAGPRGLTKQQLLTLLGPTRTSLRSIQRAFADLRTHHDADLVCFGKLHRWRLDSPLPLPLLAPDTADLVAFVYLLALAEPVVSAESHARLKLVVEELDARARRHTPAADLPHAGVITSSYTNASRVDLRLVGHLLLACRRATVRIHYESPWQDAPGVTVHDVEPWAIHVHDATHYLRAWSLARKRPRTFNCAFIRGLERLDGAPVRRPVPARPWAEDRAKFGVDSDRPGIAVVRFDGRVARLVSSMHWHPEQRDTWIDARGQLERTLPYHSCREFTRHLAPYFDAIVSIQPRDLRDEVMAHCARVPALA